MGQSRTHWIVAGAAAMLLLSACTGMGHVEAKLTYPPSVPQPQPPAAEPGGLAPEAAAPPGVYFLHEADAGLDDCVYVGERVTGEGPAAIRPEAEQARARAFLDLAEQARWMGGNVVLLPTFREDFQSGRVLGRVYRCGAAQRRAIYQRAAARRQLTVVPP